MSNQPSKPFFPGVEMSSVPAGDVSSIRNEEICDSSFSKDEFHSLADSSKKCTTQSMTEVEQYSGKYLF